MWSGYHKLKLPQISRIQEPFSAVSGSTGGLRSQQNVWLSVQTWQFVVAHTGVWVKKGERMFRRSTAVTLLRGRMAVPDGSSCGLRAARDTLLSFLQNRLSSKPLRYPGDGKAPFAQNSCVVP